MSDRSFSRRTCLQSLLSVGILSSVPHGTQAAAPAHGKKVLIVYFSWAGSSETVAKEIQRLTGGDLARIERVEPYPTEYEKTTEVAKAELKAQARPAIKPLPNVQDYDIVILGHGIWSGTMPMPVRTFLESQDFSGKTVLHWTTHGGSGLGESDAVLKKELPHSTLLPSLAVYGWHGVRNLENVEKWLRSNHVI